MRMLRVIMLRERATIVHAHQAFSTLGLEACFHAKTMGYKVAQKRLHLCYILLSTQLFVLLSHFAFPNYEYFAAGSFH
jgi:hypothetical protein